MKSQESHGSVRDTIIGLVHSVAAAGMQIPRLGIRIYAVRSAVIHILHLGVCPECGGNLHSSRRRGFVERVVFRLMFIRVKRCHRCMDRFYCPPVLIFRGRRFKTEEDNVKSG